MRDNDKGFVPLLLFMALLWVVIIIGFLAILLMAQDAAAAQYRNSDDNGEIVANISAREATRIALVDDRIVSVVRGAQQVSIEHDSVAGDMFITPVAGAITAPVNMFITSERGFSYQLLLTPLDIPSEQVFIRNRDLLAQTGRNKRASRREALAELARRMVTGESNSHYKRVSSDPLWLPPSIADLDIYVVESWIGSEWHGMVMQLRANIKAEDEKVPRLEVALDEAMFMPVAAAWIPKRSLKHGEAVEIVLIRGSGGAQ